MKKFVKLTFLLLLLVFASFVLSAQTTQSSQNQAEKSKTVRVSADYVEPKKDVI
ncbi:MAG: hypothetical protein ACK4MM_00500 [Fervidobacterium sp.]